MSVHYQGRLLDSGKDLVKSTRDLVTGCPVLFKLQKQDKNRALWEWEAGDEVYAIGVFHCHKEDHPRMGFPRVRWLNVERQVQQTVCFFFSKTDRQYSCNLFGKSWFMKSIAACTYRAGPVLHHVWSSAFWREITAAACPVCQAENTFVDPKNVQRADWIHGIPNQRTPRRATPARRQPPSPESRRESASARLASSRPF